MKKLICIITLIILFTSCGNSWKKNTDGIIIQLKKSEHLSTRYIRLEVINENIIHVSATPDKFSIEKNLVFEKKNTTPNWSTIEENGSVILQTDSIRAFVNLQTGEIKFTDIEDQIILQENINGGKSFKTVEVEGTKGYSLHQIFESPDDEAFYGLGQHQSDEFNYKGKNETLFQYNTKVSIPFIISNKNYGILWNNYSITKFGDVRDYEQLSQFKLYNLEGAEGGLSATYYINTDTTKIYTSRTENCIDYENQETFRNFPADFPFNNSTIVWEGDLQAKEKGIYRFLLYYAGYTKIWIDGKLMVDKCCNTRNSSVAKFNVNMEVGKHHHIRLEWQPEGDGSYIGLKALSPVETDEQNKLSFSSEIGNQIDYYFIKGHSMDDVIKGYRYISGKAQVMPKSAMGLRQCCKSDKGQYELQVNWREEICTCWEDYKAQISAGLNHSLSGNPYWKMDIGGFCVQKKFELAKEGTEAMEEWRELNARWTQFGAFAPLFRTHGQCPYKEVYNIAPETHPAYKTIVYYDKLRYHLMPYIYSIAGWVYLNDYTIMRPMVMDFGFDMKVNNLGDQYMFGPSLLVCPVYEYKACKREVYFPKNTDWYDFYTGAYINGGEKKMVDAPYDRMPLFVKAGSIIPIGEEIQYASEKPEAPITLYVYGGKNGSFTLYEDEGTNYNYEKGKYSTITFDYNDSLKEIKIGERRGDFETMIKERTFHFIILDKQKERGFDVKAKPDVTVIYDGSSKTIKL